MNGNAEKFDMLIIMITKNIVDSWLSTCPDRNGFRSRFLYTNNFNMLRFV